MGIGGSISPKRSCVTAWTKSPATNPLLLICGSGPRSYESQLLLRHCGIKNTRNIQGGVGMVIRSDPDFVPEK